MYVEITPAGKWAGAAARGLFRSLIASIPLVLVVGLIFMGVQCAKSFGSSAGQNRTAPAVAATPVASAAASPPSIVPPPKFSRFDDQRFVLPPPPLPRHGGWDRPSDPLPADPLVTRAAYEPVPSAPPLAAEPPAYAEPPPVAVALVPAPEPDVVLFPMIVPVDPAPRVVVVRPPHPGREGPRRTPAPATQPAHVKKSDPPANRQRPPGEQQVPPKDARGKAGATPPAGNDKGETPKGQAKAEAPVQPAASRTPPEQPKPQQRTAARDKATTPAVPKPQQSSPPSGKTPASAPPMAQPAPQKAENARPQVRPQPQPKDPPKNENVRQNGGGGNRRR